MNVINFITVVIDPLCETSAVFGCIGNIQGTVWDTEIILRIYNYYCINHASIVP